MRKVVLFYNYCAVVSLNNELCIDAKMKIKIANVEKVIDIRYFFMYNQTICRISIVKKDISQYLNIFYLTIFIHLMLQ